MTTQTDAPTTNAPTTQPAPRSWTRVTIELVAQDDPEYGEYEVKSIGEGGNCGAASQVMTRAEMETDPALADLRANRAIARRVADLLLANPDVLTEGRQFQVRVHHPDTV